MKYLHKAYPGIILLGCLLISQLSYSQEFLPKLDQYKSIQKDSISFYYKDSWINSKDINKNDPAGFLTRASSKIELGYLKEAMQDINKAISIDSTFGHSYFMRGYLMLKRDSLKSALSDFNKSIALNDTNIYNYYYRAEIYSKLKNFHEAEFCYNKAIRMDDKFTDAYFGLANLDLMKNKYTEAEYLFKKITELQPSLPFAYYNVALLHLYTDQVQSMKYLNKAIEVSPDFAQAYYVRGCLEKFQGLNTATYKDWQNAIKLDPHNNMYHVTYGLLNIDDKHYDVGVKEITEASVNYRIKNFINYFDQPIGEKIANDFVSQFITYSNFSTQLSKNEKVKTISALCFFFNGRFDKAKEIYSDLISNSSSPALFHYLSGINFEYLRSSDESLEHYGAAINQSTFPTEAHLRSGIVLCHQGKYDEAIRSFKKYLTSNDSMRMIHHTLADLYLNISKYDSAIYEYNKLIKSDPAKLDVYTDRANLFKKMGKYKEAMEDYVYVSTHNPFDIESTCLLAECKYATGDTIGAFNILKNEYQTTGSLTNDGYFLLGSISLLHKQYDSAILYFNKDLLTKNKHLEALIYRGLCYYSKEDYIKAKNDLTSAIKINNNDMVALFTRGLANIKLQNLNEAYSDLNKADSLGHPLARRAILIYLKNFKPPEIKN